MYLISRATTLTANLLNASQTTRLSTMTQSTQQSCRFILLTFLAELLKFFKGKKKKELSPSNPRNCKFHLGSKDRTMCVPILTLSMGTTRFKSWNGKKKKLEWWLAILVFRAEVGSALQSASRIGSHTGHMVCQTGNGLISQNSFSFSLYFHMTIANSPDSYQSTILGSMFHCTKKLRSKNTKR